MDLITDLPPSTDEHVSMLILVDCFSIWVEVFPLKSEAAAEVATVLYPEFFGRYVKPALLGSDASKAWRAEVVEFA